MVPMKHVMYANKSLLMGDEAADLLAEYAAALAEYGHADNVVLRAVGADGTEVDATFVLNSSSELVIETINSTAQPPSNDEHVAYMRDAILRLASPPQARPLSKAEAAFYSSDF